MLKFEDESNKKEEKTNVLYINNYNTLPRRDMKFKVLEDMGRKRQRILFKIEDE